MPCLVKSLQTAAFWCSLYSFCVGLGRQAQYICGVVQGGSFTGFGGFPARLSGQVEPGTILPLRVLYSDLILRNPEPQDSPVCCPYQSDGNPTLDVSSRPRVGFLPLCFEAAGYPFCVNRRLHTQYPIDSGDKQRKMSTFLEACLQVHFLLCLLCLLKEIFWCLR